MNEKLIPESQVAVYADVDGRLHVSTLVRERNEARAESEALRARLDAVERLLACYRAGTQPSEKLHRDLASSRDALAAIDAG